MYFLPRKFILKGIFIISIRDLTQDICFEPHLLFILQQSHAEENNFYPWQVQALSELRLICYNDVIPSRTNMSQDLPINIFLLIVVM